MPNLLVGILQDIHSPEDLNKDVVIKLGENYLEAYSEQEQKGLFRNHNHHEIARYLKACPANSAEECWIYLIKIFEQDTLTSGQKDWGSLVKAALTLFEKAFDCTVETKIIIALNTSTMSRPTCKKQLKKALVIKFHNYFNHYNVNLRQLFPDINPGEAVDAHILRDAKSSHDKRGDFSKSITGRPWAMTKTLIQAIGHRYLGKFGDRKTKLHSNQVTAQKLQQCNFDSEDPKAYWDFLVKTILSNNIEVGRSYGWLIKTVVILTNAAFNSNITLTTGSAMFSSPKPIEALQQECLNTIANYHWDLAKINVCKLGQLVVDIKGRPNDMQPRFMQALALRAQQKWHTTNHVRVEKLRNCQQILVAETSSKNCWKFLINTILDDDDNGDSKRCNIDEWLLQGLSKLIRAAFGQRVSLTKGKLFGKLKPLDELKRMFISSVDTHYQLNPELCEMSNFNNSPPQAKT